MNESSFISLIFSVIIMTTGIVGGLIIALKGSCLSLTEFAEALSL